MREALADGLGLLAIVALLVGGLWAAYGLGLPTGGDELVEVVK